MATKKKTESSSKKLKETAKKQGSKESTVKKNSPSNPKQPTAKKNSVSKKSVAKPKASQKKQTNSKPKTSNNNKKSISKPITKNNKTNKTTSTSSKTKKTSMQKTKKTEHEFPTSKWGNDSILSFEVTEQLPPPELTSIAGGFVFYEDKLILANIPGRGWEIIGGRIDVDEDPIDTFKREALNQVGVEVEHVQMIGVVRIEHTGPEPPNCPYPFPVGYAVQYVGIAKEMKKFYGGSDSLGRSAITPEGFREHYYEWNEYYDAVFRYAYEVYQKMKKKLKL